eukprot:TRINITY_DN4771_c0_g1_i1.p1 TRINITY_DN4771_c0_g1~~TRINITY_DN4771_c0_g1_i1.p1  ORF type:complete len:149 (-),score=13.25 TRINITY_DN4771_c0_g1_i1:93-515(-)
MATSPTEDWPPHHLRFFWACGSQTWPKTPERLECEPIRIALWDCTRSVLRNYYQQGQAFGVCEQLAKMHGDCLKVKMLSSTFKATEAKELFDKLKEEYEQQRKSRIGTPVWEMRTEPPPEFQIRPSFLKRTQGKSEEHQM